MLRIPRLAEVVELRGPDARRFANGMFTNNVRDMAVGAHHASAMTDDRGRIQGLLDVLCPSEGRFVLVLDGMSADTFEATYGLFIVFDDVELVRPAASVHVLIGVQPPEGLLAWPSPRVAGAWEVIVEGELPASLADVPAADPSALDALRIARGWPSAADASDKQLPHELGLRDTHLHFEKGCYRGQETIHRVDVMGQVRKGLVGLRLARVEPVGSPVLADGKEIGRLGTSAVHGDLGPIGLAVVRSTHSEPGTQVQVGEGSAEVAALPFVPR